MKHITECAHCGGTSLSWGTTIRSTTNVVDGRLRAHEMECIFFLGCDDCSETLQTIKADAVAGSLQSLLNNEKAKGGV